MLRIVLQSFLVLCFIATAYGQTLSQPAKEYNAGEAIPLVGSLQLKVFAGCNWGFSGIATKGRSLVVCLQFSDEKQTDLKVRSVGLRVSRENKTASDVSLIVGTRKLLPIAMVDGFTDNREKSLPGKNAKALMLSEDTVFSGTIVEGTSAKPFVSFLFNSPLLKSDNDKKLVLLLDLGAERFSLVIRLGN